MPDEGARLPHRLQVRQGHAFRAGQGEQRVVIGQHLLSLGGWERCRVAQQVVLDLLPDDLGQHQPADAGGTQREHRFIEPPGGDKAARQDVRVQKEAEGPPGRHGRGGRGRAGRRSASAG